jgi:TonB family protein
VQTAGFGAQELSHGTAKVAQADSGPATTQVEILSKPRPVYTKEALQLKLEGEVLLEVLFGANGQLHVNRVVRGLGHGLDEAAMSAASQMRFKPAQRVGTPVDSTAIVHVVFQLAY